MADEKRDELESQLDSLLAEAMGGGDGAPGDGGERGGVSEGDAALREAGEEAVRDGAAGGDRVAGVGSGSGGGGGGGGVKKSEKVDNASLADQLEALLNESTPAEDATDDVTDAGDAGGVEGDSSEEQSEGLEEDGVVVEGGVEGERVGAAAAGAAGDGPADMSFIDAALAADAQQSIEAEVEGGLSDESVAAGAVFEDAAGEAGLGEAGTEGVDPAKAALESSLDELIRDSMTGAGGEDRAAEEAGEKVEKEAALEEAAVVVEAAGGVEEAADSEAEDEGESEIEGVRVGVGAGAGAESEAVAVSEGLGEIEAITEEVEVEDGLGDVVAEGAGDEGEEAKVEGEVLAGGFESPDEVAEDEDFDEVPDELEGGFEAPELEEELAAAAAAKGAGDRGERGVAEADGGADRDGAGEGEADEAVIEPAGGAGGAVGAGGGRWGWAARLVEYLDRPLANRADLVRDAVGFAAFEMVAGGLWLVVYAATGGGMVSMIVAVMLGTALLFAFYRMFLAKKGGGAEDVEGVEGGEARGGAAG